jgi:CubicO group peptidase (beta-lactamase class C family)
MTRTLVLVTTALLVGGPTHTRAQRPDTVALAREIPGLMKVGDVPGLSIVVIHEGVVIWTGAFGTLGDSVGTPMNDETIFSVASLSKPVFAYAVLRLVERGEFDLDRPLVELLEYPRVTHDERAGAITPRMVLSHGTGLPNWGGEQLELQFDPGTGFNYSGEGFVYLQRAVEHVTGLSLEDLVRREVFVPLGMLRSSYVWQKRFAGNAVYGKDWAWRMLHVVRYEQSNAASSLLTTAGDYARFVTAILNGTGLAAETVRMMLAPEREARRVSRVTAADDQVSWGLGWGLQEGRAGRAFWHWGDNGRFKAYVVAYPETGTGVVYFANANDGLSIAEAIVSRVMDDDHWALRWLNYDRYDDPERLAVKAVQLAAVEEGGDAAIAAYRETRRDPGQPVGLARSLSLADFLDARGLDTASRRLLELAVEDYPDSARTHQALAEARLNAGEYEAALAAQRKALELAPGDEGQRRRVRWIEQRIAVRDRPVVVPVPVLERYVGD